VPKGVCFSILNRSRSLMNYRLCMRTITFDTRKKPALPSCFSLALQSE
jgi:hypothetical protein